MKQVPLPSELNAESTSRYLEEMTRCRSCILPASFPGISFDEEGVCCYCKQHRPVQVLGEEELNGFLSPFRGRGAEFDCILTLSGGRDSTYVLHQMVRKFGMRALALTVDSGYITPEGEANIEQTVAKLGVPHVWLRDGRQISLARRNTRHKFRGWLKTPSIHTIVPVLNTGDKTMNLRINRYARAHHIPLVVGGNIVGNSNFEEEHFKTGFLGIFPDDRGIYSAADKLKLVGLFAWECLKAPYNYRPSILGEYLRGLAVYFFDDQLRPGGVEALGFFDYIYWREEQIVKTICEFGWQSPPDATTTWRIGDSAYPLIDYIYLKLTGFTEHDEMYSKMIREGQLKRDEGLGRCLRDHRAEWIHGARLDGLLGECDVTRAELDRTLDEYRVELFRRYYLPRWPALTVVR